MSILNERLCLLNKRFCPFLLWLRPVLFKFNFCRFQHILTKYLPSQHYPENFFLLQKTKFKYLLSNGISSLFAQSRNSWACHTHQNYFACNPIAISKRRGSKYHFQESLCPLFILSKLHLCPLLCIYFPTAKAAIKQDVETLNHNNF